MKKFLLFLFLPLFLQSSFAQTTEVGGFEFEGLDRDYFVYLPAGYTPGDQLPLVFNFHGITSTSGQQYSYTGVFGGMNTVADTGQFIVCYPEGTKIPTESGFEWNVGFSFSTSTADDVGFINALIDTLHAKYDINLDRVYACGMSNGGYMAYKLACDLTDRFQAIASVTGSMVPEEFAVCNPTNTIPVMQIHNTSDSVVLYAGFDFGVSMDDLMDRWTNENFCLGDADSVAIADIDPTDGSTVDKFTWNNCQGNRQVVHFRVNGGAHTWPGSSLVFAPTNKDINASKEIWDFFNQYNAPITTSTEVANPNIEVQISPNPFVDHMQIASPAGLLQSYTLYNAVGQIVKTATSIDAYQVDLDARDLIPGAYYLQVSNAIGVNLYKVIKE